MATETKATDAMNDQLKQQYGIDGCCLTELESVSVPLLVCRVGKPMSQAARAKLEHTLREFREEHGLPPIIVLDPDITLEVTNTSGLKSQLQITKECAEACGRVQAILKGGSQ